MQNLKIIPFKEGQEIAVNTLIRNVYNEFVAPDYTAEGNRFFYDWIEPAKIKERQTNGRTMLLAMVGTTLAGIIEIRDNNHISLLFTSKAYQGRGIARTLLHEAMKACLQNNPDLTAFYVHASPFSVPIYRKLGFVETNIMQENNGIRYIPMEMRVKL
jgi:GNAT superfamily N-acetyltransferase